MSIGIAPGNPRRIYAWVTAKPSGLYRSDDSGESWTRINTENRVWGRGDDFANVRVDPANPDIVYAANTSTYRSTDGGRTYAFRVRSGIRYSNGAPVRPEDFRRAIRRVLRLRLQYPYWKTLYTGIVGAGRCARPRPGRGRRRRRDDRAARRDPHGAGDDRVETPASRDTGAAVREG